MEQLLDKVGGIADDTDRISLGNILEAVGRRSFGPLLLMAGVILVSPLSGIPGVPTTMGTFVLLIVLQLPFRREGFWLPHWLLRRSVARNRVDKALERLRAPACFIDHWLRPRLTVFVSGISIYLITIICLLIALCMPLMEIVPFSASSAGVVFVAYGLSLIAYDGFLALFAYALTVIIFGFVVHNLL
ncbi:MAG: exopolysaccharide biosynthesis protein [Desulfurivibrionaceae bacterium]